MRKMIISFFFGKLVLDVDRWYIRSHEQQETASGGTLVMGRVADLFVGIMNSASKVLESPKVSNEVRKYLDQNRLGMGRGLGVFIGMSYRADPIVVLFETTLKRVYRNGRGDRSCGE